MLLLLLWDTIFVVYWESYFQVNVTDLGNHLCSWYIRYLMSTLTKTLSELTSTLYTPRQPIAELDQLEGPWRNSFWICKVQRVESMIPCLLQYKIEYFLLLKVLCCFFYFLNIQRFGITSPSIQHTRLFWELDVREEMWYSPGHELKWFPSV